MNIKHSNRLRLESGLWFLIFLIALIPALFRDIERFGDSSDYVMMGSSMAYDADLLYSEKDLLRIQRMKPSGTDFPAGMFLIRDDSNRLLIGGHSFYYSLFAAPFFRVLGIRGFQVFNSLLWFLFIILIFVRFHPGVGMMRYGLLLAGMLFSATYDYIIWQTPATWLLVMSGLYLHFYETRRWIGAGVFLGMAGASQYPLFLWVIVPCIDIIRRRLEIADMLTILIAMVVVSAPQVLFFRLGAGTWHVTWLDLSTSSRYLYYPFYFPGESLFDRARHAIVFARFARVAHFNPLDLLKSVASPKFGLLWFYPFTIFAVVRMIRERSSIAPVIAAIVILSAFCTAGRLETHQVGLRYLNPIYPVFVLGFRRIRIDRLEKLVLIIVLILGLSFALFPGANSEENHTHKMTIPAIVERFL